MIRSFDSVRNLLRSLLTNYLPLQAMPPTISLPTDYKPNTQANTGRDFKNSDIMRLGKRYDSTY